MVLLARLALTLCTVTAIGCGGSEFGAVTQEPEGGRGSPDVADTGNGSGYLDSSDASMADAPGEASAGGAAGAGGGGGSAGGGGGGLSGSGGQGGSAGRGAAGAGGVADAATEGAAGDGRDAGED